MEADQIVAIEIEAVAWNRRDSTAIDQCRIEVPDDLDTQMLRAHLEARFGRSTGTVNTLDDSLGDITVGWLFPPAALAGLGLDHPGATLLAVPFVRFADGSRRELFIHNAELQARFAELARSIDDGDPTEGRLHPPNATAGTTVGLGGPPEDPSGRLEDEQLQLYHSDREGIALEIGGWLRRMLGEGHTFIVMEIGEDGRYLQFVTHDGSWLRGEAVGPVHLEGCPPLSDRELLTLLAIGWHEPEKGPGGGNFWREWGDPDTGEPVEIADAADLAATTLTVAFGPVDPSGVRIVTGSSRPGELH